METIVYAIPEPAFARSVVVMQRWTSDGECHMARMNVDWEVVYESEIHGLQVLHYIFAALTKELDYKMRNHPEFIAEQVMKDQIPRGACVACIN